MKEAFIGRKEFPKEYLDPETIASAIVAQMLSGQSGQLFFTGKVTAVERDKGFPCLVAREDSGTRFQSHLRLNCVVAV